MVSGGFVKGAGGYKRGVGVLSGDVMRVSRVSGGCQRGIRVVLGAVRRVSVGCKGGVRVVSMGCKGVRNSHLYNNQ